MTIDLFSFLLGVVATVTILLAARSILSGGLAIKTKKRRSTRRRRSHQ